MSTCLTHLKQIIACMAQLISKLFEPILGLFLQMVCLFDQIDTIFPHIRLVKEYILVGQFEPLIRFSIFIAADFSSLRPNLVGGFCLIYPEFNDCIIIVSLDKVFRKPSGIF